MKTNKEGFDSTRFSDGFVVFASAIHLRCYFVFEIKDKKGRFGRTSFSELLLHTYGIAVSFKKGQGGAVR